MIYWIKIAVCAVVILAFGAIEIIGPDQSSGWPLIFKGILMTLAPIAFVYLLVLAYKGEEKSSTHN